MREAPFSTAPTSTVWSPHLKLPMDSSQWCLLSRSKHFFWLGKCAQPFQESRFNKAQLLGCLFTIFPDVFLLNILNIRTLWQVIWDGWSALVISTWGTGKAKLPLVSTGLCSNPHSCTSSKWVAYKHWWGDEEETNWRRTEGTQWSFWAMQVITPWLLLHIICLNVLILYILEGTSCTTA